MADDECIVLSSDSDEEQQAAPAAKRARQGAAAAADGDIEFVDAQPAPLLADDGADDGSDDDDVRVVGTKGETALKDFPHPRSACLNFPFDLTHHKLQCAKCFCFVCDTLASECESWGDGSDTSHHCHATGTERSWQMARTARQAQQAAAQAPAPPAHPGFGGGAFGGGGGWAAPPARVGPPTTVPGVLPAGHVRQPPSAPEHLPDPATLPGLLHLSSLRLAVKVAKDAKHTLSEIQARLAPFGLCVKDTHGAATDSSGPLGLRALYAAMTHYTTAASTAALLELLPLPPLSSSLTTRDKLPVRLIIMHSNGSAAPKEHCVLMPRDSKKRDLLARAVTLSGADMQTEQIVILQVDTPTRVAGEPAQCPITAWIAGARRESYHGTAYGDDDKLLDEKLPFGTRLRGTYQTFVAYRLPAGKFVAVHLRRRGVRKVTHKRARDVRHFGKESELQTRTPNGLVALLPMPSASLNGGPAAHAELMASLKLFMTPLLKPEQEYVAPSALVHSTATGRWEETLTVYWHSQGHEVAETSYSVVKEPTGPYGQVASAELKSSLLRFAAADWSASTLETCFDINSMVTPHDCDPSALADRAAELETLQHEWEEERSAKRPRQVMDELRSASEVSWNYHSGAYDPATHTRSEGSWSRSTPLLRIKAALVQTDDDRTGELAVDLYVAANPASTTVTGVQHCLPLFAVSADGPGERYSGHGSGTAAALRETMNTLLERDSPNHATNARAWRELEYRFGRDPSVLTINGLLAAVESQERHEAPQPPGLSVQLRPYQRQALSFMLDAEKLEGAGHFWSECPLPAASGGAGSSSGRAAAVWFSPMLNRLTREEPARCAGGMLSSEMGLGKTVISLACVLAAPQEPAVTAAKQAAYNAAIAAATTPAAKKKVILPTHATLVVCAVSLVGQWCAEVQSKLSADSALKIHMYHGQGRIKDPSDLAAFDVVVTTYQTLAADYAKRDANDSFPPLGSIHWHRVLLDEAHLVKAVKSQQSAACIALHADRRWCCTGTPIGTDVADLFGQFCFLRLSPLDKSSYFDAFVKRVFTITGQSYGGSGPMPLLYCLSRCMIRHTKLQVLGNAPVLTLPPKTETLVPVVFTAAERAAYDKVHAAAKAQFDNIKSQGQAAVSQRMLQIMALLLPLRRMASGGALSAKDLTVPDLAAAAAARAAAAVARAQAHAAELAAGVKPEGGAAGVKPEGGGSGADATGGAGPSSAGGAGPSGAAAAARSKEQEAEAVEAAMASDAKPVLTISNDDDELCGLCGDLPENPCRTGCMHWFCTDCLLGALPERASASKCPTCQKYVNPAPIRALAGGGGSANGEDDEAPAPAPASKPKPNPKPKARGRGKARAPVDSEPEDSDESDDSDFMRDDAPVVPSSRPRRQAAVAAKARTAAATAAVMSEGEEGDDGADASGDYGAEGSEEEEEPAAAKPKPKPKPKPAATAKDKGKGPASEDSVALRSESKLRALLKLLKDMRDEDETAKALIFSQFNGTLEWLKTRLTEEGFGFRTINGSMPLKQRAKAIDAFQNDPPTTVFLLSMRSGAVGITLTSASHVFLMEPVMNPALEAQAIGRSWRMGQLRPVTVHKLYIKDSVEERIMELVAQRVAPGGKPTEGASAMDALRASKGKAKILVSEIAGAIRDDKQALRLTELELLFS